MLHYNNNNQVIGESKSVHGPTGAGCWVSVKYDPGWWNLDHKQENTQ